MAIVGRTDVADPGAQQDQVERLAHRRERLYTEDEQFRISGPDEVVAEAARRPGLRIAEVMAEVMEACRITEQTMVDVQERLAPGVRQIDLSAVFARRTFELGAKSNMLEAIWQVMPGSRAEGAWTTHGDLALPLLTTERELAAGDVLWTDVSITYGANVRISAARGWWARSRRRVSRSSSRDGAPSLARC
jgi:hypothetical protein